MPPIRSTVAMLLAAGLLSDGAPAQAKAPGKSVYGAIAVNRDTRAFGYTYDFKSAPEAKREALKRCGERNCVVVASFKNGCAATAHGRDQIATTTGKSREEAEAKALRKCGKDCTVLAWTCTKP